MKFDKVLKEYQQLQPLEIKSGPEPYWNWNKPSKGVIVIGRCGSTVVLHGAGPVFDEWASDVSWSAGDMGLDQYDGEGIYVWEGNLHTSRTWEGDYDCELVGDIREPTPEEWEAICRHDCPWSNRDWLWNPCEIADCDCPAEDGYPVCDDHRKEIEEK